MDVKMKHGSHIWYLQGYESCEAKVEEQGDGGHTHLQTPASSTTQPVTKFDHCVVEVVGCSTCPRE